MDSTTFGNTPSVQALLALPVHQPEIHRTDTRNEPLLQVEDGEAWQDGVLEMAEAAAARLPLDFLRKLDEDTQGTVCFDLAVVLGFSTAAVVRLLADNNSLEKHLPKVIDLILAQAAVEKWPRWRAYQYMAQQGGEEAAH